MTWQQHLWLVTGATIAEFAHFEDEHFDLEASFQFLLSQSKIAQIDPAEARRLFFEGHAAYLNGQAVRVNRQFYFLEVTRGSKLA